MLFEEWQRTGQYFPNFVRELGKYSQSGFLVDDNKVVKICHLPRVAPNAWLHTIYPSVDPQLIVKVKTLLRVELPQEYQNFMRFCNGATLFHTFVEIWGLTTAKRPDSANPAFDLVVENKKRILNGIQHHNTIMIASYSYGDTIHIEISPMPSESAHVLLLDKSEGNILQEWSSLSEWLDYEMTEGRMQYDYAGNEV